MLIRIMILLIAISASAHAAGIAPQSHSFRHDGEVRDFLVYLPSSRNAAEPAPLVLVLHGGGGMPHQLDKGTKFELSRMAEETGWIMIMPAGIDKAGMTDASSPAMTRILTMSDL